MLSFSVKVLSAIFIGQLALLCILMARYWEGGESEEDLGEGYGPNGSPPSRGF